MKKLGTIIFCLLICFAVKASDDETKTFLFLFKQKELKSLKLSLKDIEEQLGVFETRSYGGNSELALFVETSNHEFDACFIGQFLLRNDKNVNVKLEEIAFRMIDLSKTKEAKDLFLVAYEESLQKKKTDKNAQKP